MEKKKGKRLLVAILAMSMALGIIVSAGFGGEASAATEKAITDIPWNEVEKVIKQKVGEGYNEVGLCTGFVYWCLKNAYGVDWGDNSVVNELEAKLKDKGITKVAEGTDGTITEAMKPGDIIIFLQNGGGTHCGILGEAGKFYHAATSSGVVYNQTLAEWMALPEEVKPCAEYRIYRGIVSTGEAELVKSSAVTAITKDNDCYSIKGAEYGVYDNKACTSKVGTFTVKADGTSDVLELNAGTYYVKETKAPKGYKLDATVYTAKVEAGELETVKAEDEPKATTTLLNLYKTDGETKMAEPQGSASLAGTRFIWRYYDGYYTKANLPATPVRTWVTQTKAEIKDGETAYVTRLENGFKISGDDFYTLNGKTCIPLGTLTVEELAPPEGYKLDSATLIKAKDTGEEANGLYVTQIREDGQIAELQGSKEFFVFDEAIRGGIKVQKRDNETKEKLPQGDASLSGAEFTITTLNDGPVLVDGKLYTKGQPVKIITTNKEGMATTAADSLPYGKYRIQETKSPAGYLLTGSISKEFIIKEDGRILEFTNTEQSFFNDIIRGGVKVQKRDLETGKPEAQGGAVLSGAEFTITTLNDGPVLVDGKLYTKGQPVKTMITNEEGVAATAADSLPYGKYEIEEVTPPDGYLSEGADKRTFEIREDGKTVDLTDEETSIYNQVKRGDLEGVKIGAGTHKRLAGVPFRITSLSTGENHIIVTDENGQFSTSSDWASHKSSTNEGETAEDGIWFGEGEPDDSKGALIYDKYEIEELPCDSNEGMKLIPPFEIKVYRDNSIIHLGTLTDEYEDEITIKTSAVNKDTEDKYISSAADATIIDTVTMTGLKKGAEYTVKGWQMVKEDEAVLYANGAPVASELGFVAENSDMEVQMEFIFDASGLSGKSLVAFEELYEISEGGEPVKVAEHTDIDNESQTVTIVDAPQPRNGEKKPAEPAMPETSTEQSNPAEPVQPAAPEKPVEPTEPSQPVQPEEKAGDRLGTGDVFPVLPVLVIMTTAFLTGAVVMAEKRQKR